MSFYDIIIESVSSLTKGSVNMNGKLRRIKVLAMIKESDRALSASFLAKELNVSRQVIVGDVALLRAEGQEIIATSRGYIFQNITKKNQYIRKIACQHTPEQTIDELYLLVDLGIRVNDVTIEHEVYGELTGYLGIECRADADLFIKKLEKSQSRLLSELTMGIHLHTVRCRNKEHFNEVLDAMKKAGYLVSNK